MINVYSVTYFASGAGSVTQRFTSRAAARECAARNGAKAELEASYTSIGEAVSELMPYADRMPARVSAAAAAEHGRPVVSPTGCEWWPDYQSSTEDA
jgi:hypothetical protein